VTIRVTILGDSGCQSARLSPQTACLMVTIEEIVTLIVTQIVTLFFRFFCGQMLQGDNVTMVSRACAGARAYVSPARSPERAGRGVPICGCTH
jgi:hypothetical protein